jgi:hypothetical protein
MATQEDIEPQPASPDKPNSGMSVMEWLRYSFFSIITVIAILNQLEIAKTFEIERGISQDILSADEFFKISNTTDVVDWIEDYFVPKLIQLEFYPHNIALYNSTQARVAWFNILTTSVRMVQKRVELKDNPSDRNNEYNKYAWEVLSYDILAENPHGEMTSAYGPLDLFQYNGNIGISNSGGYQQNINATVEHSSLEKFRKAVEFLTSNNWIDRQTNALYIDFSTYNGHIGMLSYINILIEISAAGSVEKNIKTTSMNVEPYNSGADSVRAVLEVLFILLSLLYAAIEVYKIKLEVAAKRMEMLEDDQGLHIGVPKMVWEGVKMHFSYFWNWMDFASVLLSFIIIGLWIQYISYPLVVDGPNSEDMLDQLLELKSIYEKYVSVCSINFLLIFIRMLKYLNRFERVQLLQATFETAKDDIFYFFVLLLTVFLAFVIFGFVAFGSTSKNFSSMGASTLSCFFLIFGDLTTWFAIKESNPLSATFFFFLFTFLIIFILVNMFVAIITNSYQDNFEKLEKSKKDDDQDKVHPLLQVWHKVKAIFWNIADYFNKNRRLAKKFAGAEENLTTVRDTSMIKISGYNLNYKTSKRHKELIDSEVLTDKEILIKLSELTQERRLELKAALIFFSFALIYAVTLIQQIQIGTKHMLVSSLKEAIENQEYIYQNDSYNVTQIFNYETFYLWSEQLPFLFEKQTNGEMYVLDNYLVGYNLPTNLTAYDQGPIRMTYRRIDMKDNPSSYYDELQAKVRTGSLGPFSITSSDEDEKSFVGGSTNFYYEADASTSFMDNGGFVLYFSSDSKEFKLQLDGLKNDLMLNDTSASVVYDFVLYNGNSNNVIYSAITFEFLSGGGIISSLYIWPLELQMYTTPGQIVRGIFEGVYAVLLLYHILETCLKLKQQSDSYTIWQNRLYEALNEEQKIKRQKAQPEWLRRFFSIVDVYLLIDLVAYVLGLLSIAAWATYLTQTAYGPVLPEDSVDYFDSTDTLARALKYYLDLSSLSLLLIFLRLIKFMQMSKSLSFLQNTISEAIVDIYFFCIMLGALMLGFVFMAYLAFGPHAKSFSSITSALTTCFQMIIGDFNYKEMSDANPQIAPLFFIFYLFLFVFVLLNIFTAILERAYSRVKQESDGERTSPINFISVLIEFCVRKIKGVQAQQAFIEDDKTDILPEEVFVKMDNGLDGEPEAETWAVRFSEHILMERSKRAQVRAKLDILFKRRKTMESEGKAFLVSRAAVKAEMRARLKLWNYLKVGFLSLSVQEKLIVRQTKAHEESNRRVNDKFLEVHKETEDLLARVEQLDVKLMESSEELSKLQNLVAS